jgi:ankyrin repeat protein
LLKKIHEENLFPIHQKDDYSGDNVIHYAIFENKVEFIAEIAHLYENEINLKNEDGNTPFHYACLKGN